MPDGPPSVGGTSDATRQLQALAAEEGCDPEDMLHEAIGLYLSLPAPARRSLRGIERLGDPDDRVAAGAVAGRAIVKLAFDVALRAMAVSGAKYAAEHGLVDEDAAIEEAVRITREARHAAG